MTDTFKLDTSGAVRTQEVWAPDAFHLWQWSDLSPFTQGYIGALMGDFVVCLLTQTVGFDHPHIVAFGDKVRALAFADLAPETLARIIADCEAMQAGGMVGTAEVGRIAWEARQQGTYAGFPPLTVQLGDDGKVRFA